MGAGFGAVMLSSVKTLFCQIRNEIKFGLKP